MWATACPSVATPPCSNGTCPATAPPTETPKEQRSSRQEPPLLPSSFLRLRCSGRLKLFEEQTNGHRIPPELRSVFLPRGDQGRHSCMKHFTIILPTRNRHDTLYWTIKNCLAQ